MRDGHLLDLFLFYGREYRAVDEVRGKSDVFCRIFGSAVTRKAEFAWFEVEHTVGYSGRKIDPPVVIRQVDAKNAVNGAKTIDLSIVYSFESANSREKPMVKRLSIALRSPEAMRARRLRTNIVPPAGYEHLSLEPRITENASPATPGTEKHATSPQQSPAIAPNIAASPDQPATEKVTHKTVRTSNGRE